MFSALIWIGMGVGTVIALLSHPKIYRALIGGQGCKSADHYEPW